MKQETKKKSKNIRSNEYKVILVFARYAYSYKYDQKNIDIQDSWQCIESLGVSSSAFAILVIRWSSERIRSKIWWSSCISVSEDNMKSELSKFKIIHYIVRVSKHYCIRRKAESGNLPFWISNVLLHHTHQFQNLRHILYDAFNSIFVELNVIANSELNQWYIMRNSCLEHARTNSRPVVITVLKFLSSTF